MGVFERRGLDLEQKATKAPAQEVLNAMSIDEADGLRSINDSRRTDRTHKDKTNDISYNNNVVGLNKVCIEPTKEA